VTQSENGIVTRTKINETIVRIRAHIPGPSGSAEIKTNIHLIKTTNIFFKKARKLQQIRNLMIFHFNPFISFFTDDFVVIKTVDLYLIFPLSLQTVTFS